MTIIAFVPDWNANPEMAAYAKSREGITRHIGGFKRWDVQFSDTFGCDIIQLHGRPQHMPHGMSEIPLQAIVVFKPDSPVTNAIDGQYVDGDVTARVETYVNDGVTQQSIMVIGTNDTPVEALNEWFDKLLAGEQAGYNVRPITYPVSKSSTAPVEGPAVHRS